MGMGGWDGGKGSLKKRIVEILRSKHDPNSSCKMGGGGFVTNVCKTKGMFLSHLYLQLGRKGGGEHVKGRE